MFQDFHEMLNEGQMVTVNLLKKGEKLIVCVLPRSENVKDEAKNHIVPLNLEGTPAELESGFITAIANPVKKVSAILKNMAEFEEKADQVASESKALKEKSEKVGKLIKEAESFEKDKPEEALATYKKALELDKYNSKIISKVGSLQEKVLQGSLFGDESVCVAAPENKLEAVIVSVQQPVIETTVKIETAMPEPPAVDMFAQMLEQTESKQPAVDNPAPVANMSPEMLAQFQQFMAFQQQNQNK